MATIAELKHAYKTVARGTLDDSVAQRISASGISIEAYVADLVAKAMPTTGAAVAVTAFITGYPPYASEHIDALKAAAEAQIASYAAMGVANPDLGAFEAFGRGLAVDPSTTNVFRAKYASLSDEDFITGVYYDVFKRDPSSAALDNLSSQLTYFTDIFTAAHVPDAEVAARGAVLGQILGYGFVQPSGGPEIDFYNATAKYLTQNALSYTTYYLELEHVRGKWGDDAIRFHPQQPDGRLDSAGLNFDPVRSSDGRYYLRYADFRDDIPVVDPSVSYAHLVLEDRKTDTTILVNVSADGKLASNGGASDPSISNDGRFVAFSSYSTNLLNTAYGETGNVFVRDLVEGKTILITKPVSGMLDRNDTSYYPVISGNGRFVVFHSFSDNLVTDDRNGRPDVFVHDLAEGTTRLVSIANGSGEQGDQMSYSPSISENGRYVAFTSFATNLVPGDTNGKEDIFVRDLVAGTTSIVSVSRSGGPANGLSQSPTISDDGRYISFFSEASNLVAGDTNGKVDVFVADGLMQGWWLG